jgi:hypothetical protein
MPVAARARDGAGMKKRVLAVFLWFYAGWYAGAILAAFAGVSELIGPIIGAAAAALFVGDPRGIIWGRRARIPARPTAPATSRPVEV